jgi:membrane fusion protein (multidrug efflux system)
MFSINHFRPCWLPIWLTTLVVFAENAELQSAQATPVIAARVVEEDFSDRIEALGTLRSRESVDLTATVSERVTFVGFEDGQRVREGDVLLKLSSKEEEALLNEVRATAKEAEQQFDRTKQLTGQGAASRAQLDEARRIYDTAIARQLAIESRLANLVLLAPFDGIVGLRNISVGALVRPGDLVTTIDEDSVMLLDFSIPSTFLSSIAVGDRITANATGYAGQKFEGEVRSISSRIDPVTRTATVRAEIPNEKRILRPGLLMTVELFTNPRRAAVIPEEALMPSGFRNSVMVAEEENGKLAARKRAVTIGSRETGKVEILEGLAPGEMVITHGALRVGEGGAIRILAEDDGQTSVREMIRAGSSKE